MTTRTKDTGATEEGSQKLKSTYEAVAAECKSMVRADAEAVLTPMSCYPM